MSTWFLAGRIIIWVKEYMVLVGRIMGEGVGNMVLAERIIIWVKEYMVFGGKGNNMDEGVHGFWREG